MKKKVCGRLVKRIIFKIITMIGRFGRQTFRFPETIGRPKKTFPRKTVAAYKHHNNAFRTANGVIILRKEMQTVSFSL